MFCRNAQQILITYMYIFINYITNKRNAALNNLYKTGSEFNINTSIMNFTFMFYIYILY